MFTLTTFYQFTQSLPAQATKKRPTSKRSNPAQGFLGFKLIAFNKTFIFVISRALVAIVESYGLMIEPVIGDCWQIGGSLG